MSLVQVEVALSCDPRVLQGLGCAVSVIARRGQDRRGQGVRLMFCSRISEEYDGINASSVLSYGEAPSGSFKGNDTSDRKQGGKGD